MTYQEYLENVQRSNIGLPILCPICDGTGYSNTGFICFLCRAKCEVDAKVFYSYVSINTYCCIHCGKTINLVKLKNMRLDLVPCDCGISPLSWFPMIQNSQTILHEAQCMYTVINGREVKADDYTNERFNNWCESLQGS